MAKRFSIIFFIVLGIIGFLCTGLFLVLMLAPGARIFGIMNVSSNARAYNSTRVKIEEELEKLGFNPEYNSITVETDEVPIYVEYTERLYFCELHYYENYIGLTKTNIDRPYYSLSKDKNGGVVISVKGFESFIFKNGATERYFKLYIPITLLDSSLGGQFDLTIKSKNSSISFSKTLGDAEIRVPKFDNLSIETNGKIDMGVKTLANNFKYTTSNSITIDNTDASVDATHYDLTSKKGKINIKKEVVGDVTATTGNGNVRLQSCRNLKVTTTHGDVLGNVGDLKINVLGMVEINTKSGKVALGKVEGGGTSEIVTSSGKVSIDKIGNGKITTKRGSVEIKSVTNMVIETDAGNVSVEEALEGLKVKTKRGKIVVGGEGMLMHNIDIFSRIGKVCVKSAYGKAKIETISSDVEFNSVECTETVIYGGGKLTATGLKGDVDIIVAKNANLTFDKIDKDTKIKAGDGCKNIVVMALANSVNDTRFALSGKNVIRYEANDNGTGSYSNMGEGANLSNRLDGTGPALTVESKNAIVSVYFKASIEA